MTGSDRSGIGTLRRLFDAVRPAGVALFLAVQIGAFVLARPYATAELRVATGLTGVLSVVLGAVLGASVVLVAVRFDAGRRLVRLTLIGAFAIAVALSAFVLVDSVPAAVAAGVSVAVSLLARPPRSVRNAIGVLAGGSIAAYLGTALTPLSVITALVVLSGYDAYSVHRSGRMRVLARAVGDLDVPAVLALPDRSRLGANRTGVSPDAWTLGLGDAVFPAALVASAESATASSVPALSALAGGCCGLVVLSALADPGESRAGLAPLAAGSTIGYLGGTLLVYGAFGVTL